MSYQRGFSTQTQECAVDALAVDGQIPAWLTGTLIRNGPAQFEAGAQPLNHWFDGFAMLHRFAFHAGRVSYASKYLQSNTYREAQAEGQLTTRQFATDPCRSIFQRVTAIFDTDAVPNANVNISRAAGHYVALTEVPIPVIFDPDTLDTRGGLAYTDDLGGQITTAHPHYDFERGESLNYVLKLGAKHEYILYAQPDNSTSRRAIARIPVQQPAYMHSFALTERYVILVEYPLVLPGVMGLLLSGKPFIANYEWQPKRGTTFLVVDRHSGEVVRRAQTDAFFSFHHVNAYEDGDNIVLDICAYPDASLIDDLFLEKVRRTYAPGGTLCRFTIDGDKVRERVLLDETFDLPRIHYRAHNGRPYRYVYGVGNRDDRPGDFINKLIKVDTHDGTARTWFADDAYPGEPVFVPAPDTRSEDDGVVLSVVLGAEGSYLLVLDAASFTEVARASIPQVVPFGFHGQFFGA